MDITYRFEQFLDHALTPQYLDNCAPHGMEAEDGYIRWFYRVSHPLMILPPEDVQVLRPPEQEALDEIAAEKDRYQEYLELSGTLTHIRDHVYVVVPQGSEE